MTIDQYLSFLEVTLVNVDTLINLELLINGHTWKSTYHYVLVPDPYGHTNDSNRWHLPLFAAIRGPGWKWERWSVSDPWSRAWKRTFWWCWWCCRGYAWCFKLSFCAANVPKLNTGFTICFCISICICALVSRCIWQRKKIGKNFRTLTFSALLDCLTEFSS